MSVWLPFHPLTSQHEGKCKFFHVGKGNAHFKYSMDGTLLDEVIEERDSGVTVTESFKEVASSAV